MSLDVNDIIEEDTFKILLATDIHLGFMEKDPIREEDTFVTFEEILKIGVEQDVDFILLGGDLFHDCRPSPYCIQKCSELIKRYCFGDKPVPIEFLSDQSYHFRHLKNPIVNYEDPNINISIPIFSIHGNHDDPTGTKAISAIDLLSTNGLINYFGRWVDVKKVEITPILLQKGTNKLALYGLSHIHDQRLARTFRDQQVTMTKLDSDDWFNLLVLHQNRAHRGKNNFIPTSCIPKFMHLTVWGHEHDCLIKPEIQDNGVYITQPGSSVATSLSEGESLPKHVGVLYVKKNKFHIEPIPLKTVRPFIFQTVELETPDDLKKDNIYDLEKHSIAKITKVIEGILKDIANQRKGKKLKEMLPLVRIIMRYHTEDQQVQGIRLGQQFIGKVANPDTILLQKQIIAGKGTGTKRQGYLDDEFDAFDVDVSAEKVGHIKDLIETEFEMSKKKEKMTVLSIKGLGQAVTRYIDQQDSSAVEDLINFQIEQTINKLKELDDVNDQNIDEKIQLLYTAREGINEENEINKMFNSANRKLNKTAVADADDDIMDIADDDAPIPTPPRPARGKGSRGPRGPRGGRGKK